MKDSQKRSDQYKKLSQIQIRAFFRRFSVAAVREICVCFLYIILSPKVTVQKIFFHEERNGNKIDDLRTRKLSRKMKQNSLQKVTFRTSFRENIVMDVP